MGPNILGLLKVVSEGISDPNANAPERRVQFALFRLCPACAYKITARRGWRAGKYRRKVVPREKGEESCRLQGREAKKEVISMR